MKKKIILDTNILMVLYQFKVDIFAELERIMDFPFEVYVVDATFDELKKLAEGDGKSARAARLGLAMLGAKGVKTLRTSREGHADDLILGIAKKGYIVATQDLGFQERLKASSIQVITLRQKKYLVFK